MKIMLGRGPTYMERISMDKIQPLFTVTAVATGGRNGHVETADHSVRVDLSLPKAMGGEERANTTTPEHLFASGYAACFGGALDFVGKQHHKDASKAKVSCSVSIGPREKGGFGLGVKLNVEDTHIPQAELVKLVNEAHEKICPYSHATRGNVDVEINVNGMKA
jgi:osmotically inducible protein OsmC